MGLGSGLWPSALDRGGARGHLWAMTHEDAPASTGSTADLSTDMSFEEALRGLEEVVRRLESGDVQLDESITLYERGEALRGACQARLDAASARIERIVNPADGGPAATRPLDDVDR